MSPVMDAFRALVPQLPVADVTRSLHYYRDVLGFRIDWRWEDGFGAVSNGDVQLFFAKADAPAPGACYCFVDDADRLYEAYRAKGVRIAEPIGSRPWGMREFTIEDPDGHRLRIGHGDGRWPRSRNSGRRSGKCRSRPWSCSSATA
jgi:catechol 2,3-dioxygenase-like lactoylglutathione lyase family enzyme